MLRKIRCLKLILDPPSPEWLRFVSQACATAAPALQAKNWGGENKLAMLPYTPPTANVSLNVANVRVAWYCVGTIRTTLNLI